MSLACLVCDSVDSPAHSLRSYSTSSSENEGKCAVVANCLKRKISVPTCRGTSSIMASSKVTPQPAIADQGGISGAPRLVRSCAVRRDQVRNWNFDVVEIGN